MSTVSYIKRVQDGYDFDDEESEWGKGTDLEASQKNKELNDSDTEIINDKKSDSIADENQWFLTNYNSNQIYNFGR